MCINKFELHVKIKIMKTSLKSVVGTCKLKLAFSRFRSRLSFHEHGTVIIDCLNSHLQIATNDFRLISHLSF